MTARPPKHPRARAAVFAVMAVAAVAVACGMPTPDLVAPKGSDPVAKQVAAGNPYFDFQVEKPASAYPSNQPPVYPSQLRAANIEGQVIAKFVVDTAGHPEMRTFEIVKSDHDAFSASVRNAVTNLRFYPARVGDHPVRQLVQMPFQFSLTHGGAVKKPVGEIGTAVASPRPHVEFETRTMQPATGAQSRVLLEVPAGDSLSQLLDGNVTPVYPSVLRAANVQGMVQAKFVVRADGSVDMGTFMITRSDHDAFSTTVREAVSTWRFRPATKNGKPVSALMNMPFIFSLSK